MQAESVELTISVPAAIADSGAGERARTLLVLDAVRSEKMTWRAAASALNVAPDQLLELTRVYGIATTRYDLIDFNQDMATLAKLSSRPTSGA
ncbi:MAG TPA: hypothetical protein VI072_34065 [Polyangiaceae bacterium]